MDSSSIQLAGFKCRKNLKRKMGWEHKHYRTEQIVHGHTKININWNNEIFLSIQMLKD